MPGYIRINNQFQLNAKKLMFLKCKKKRLTCQRFVLFVFKPGNTSTIPAENEFDTLTL